jgi:hypothetical protein
MLICLRMNRQNTVERSQNDLSLSQYAATNRTSRAADPAPATQARSASTSGTTGSPQTRTGSIQAGLAKNAPHATAQGR